MIVKLKKIVFKIVYPIMRLLWKVFKPNTTGVRVAIFNEGKEILLVKHTYRNGYFFPGGGIHNKETFENAAIREVFEEVGIKIEKENLNFKGIYQYFKEGKNDVIAFFVVKIDEKEKVKIDEVEILEANWFSLKELPEDLSYGVQDRLNELFIKQEKLYGIW